MRRILGSLLLAALVSACSMLPFHDQGFHSGYVQVRKGETLYSIAWRFDLNYRDLARWNDLQPPYNLQPGQWLRMNPSPTLSTAMPTQTPIVRKSSSQGVAHPYRETLAPSATPLHRQRPSLQKPVVGAPHLIWPTHGPVVQSFSNTSQGIEISGKSKQPIFAAASGQVVYSGSGLPSYGKLLIIKHNDHYLTAYGHNQRLLVKEGDEVKQGQRIALMGESGTDINRPILFFEIRVDGIPKNPIWYLPKTQ